MPLRVSALRTLGAFANVFAIESFMDELAAAAGADPVAFRLKHLADPRARAVIEAAARAANWQPGATGAGTRGRGLGFVYCDAQLRDELAVRATATSRPVVPGHTYPRAKQLSSKLARFPAFRQVAAEGQDTQGVAKRTVAQFVGDDSHAAVGLHARYRGNPVRPNPN